MVQTANIFSSSVGDICSRSEVGCLDMVFISRIKILLLFVYLKPRMAKLV